MSIATFSGFAGMIDWLTLRIDASLLGENVRQLLLINTGKVLKIDREGQLEWESSCRENIRSDSHQITVRFGSFLEITGSPARVVNSNNVFGSLDIKKCAFNMIDFVARHYSVFLPRNLRDWSCTRIDVTTNYDLGSLEQCKLAVDLLKTVKVGRQSKVTYDTSVSWGGGSQLHSGKVYCKGPQLRKQCKGGSSSCTDEQLDKADRLVRLEYSFKRKLISRIKENSGLIWSEFNPQFLLAYHCDYFSKFISKIEVTNMETILSDLLSKVPSEIPTESQARAAFNCYCKIKTVGPESTKKQETSSWYRHLKNLRTIGLSDADFQHINVVPLRTRRIVLETPVSGWDQIKLA